MSGAISNLSLTIPLTLIVALAIFNALRAERKSESPVKDDSPHAPDGCLRSGRPVLLFASTVDRFAGDWGWPR